MSSFLEQKSAIKKKLSKLLKDKEIIDIIIFGSVMKGKANPADIDLAIISEKEKIESIDNIFHVSMLSPQELVQTPPMLVTTLLREGFSLRHDKSFAEVFRFKSRILFVYSLVNLTPSKKVTIARILHGTKEIKGMVQEHKGEWLAHQVFTIPFEYDHLLEQFFIYKEIKFTKKYILIH